MPMRFLLLALAAAATVLAQPQPVQLKVLSTNVTDHKATVELQNMSEKPIVAYLVYYQELDASGKPLGVPLGIATDVVDELNQTEQKHVIQPMSIITVHHRVSDQAASVRVTVGAVIYADRTAEGWEKFIDNTFALRAERCSQRLKRGSPCSQQEADFYQLQSRRVQQ